MSTTESATDGPPPDVTAAAEEAPMPAARQATKPSRADTTALIDRYAWHELLAIYAGVFVFLFFLLAPFIERYGERTPDHTRLAFLSVLLGTMVDLYLVTTDASERNKLRRELDAHMLLALARLGD